MYGGDFGAGKCSREDAVYVAVRDSQKARHVRGTARIVVIVVDGDVVASAE
jgi:uncharacterized protein (DUF427 family)